MLAGAATAAGAVAVGYDLLRKPGPSESATRGGNKPNILVIIVDQMRTPQWFPERQQLDAVLPNLARLQRSSVSFQSHYTASNNCTPSRGVMTTGLYSHQTGCMFTGDGPTESSLAPKFPTWGTMLRQQGYRTWWWGKWHLGQSSDATPEGLEAHGFSGGTFPSPNGAPNQGLQRDPGIVDQFAGWFDDNAGKGPWCTTVSLINPHDINWWPKNPLPEDIPHLFTSPAANFETPEDLSRNGKPQLQIDFLHFMAPLIAGPLEHPAGQPGQPPPKRDAQWARCLDVYLWLQQQVDVQIGRVLDKLASRPEIDQNTVVVFTSDHGEYAGSHGLRGKGSAAYDEAIRVPLYIRDPHGHLTPTPGDTRDQLTSSADLAALLLTIGHGGNGWRAESRYSYLARRADLYGIAKSTAAQGRPWIAHITDDMSVELMSMLMNSPQILHDVFGTTQPPTNILTAAPSHIMAVRTPSAKLAVYSYWKPGSLDADTSRPIERELYDYSTPLGRQEIDNQAGRNAMEATLQTLIDHEVVAEVHAPLPAFLSDAQEQGLADMRKLDAQRGL